MAPPHLRALRWQSSTGKDTIQCIVKSLIPAWTEGLRDWQLDLVSRILDGEDLLVSTATGDGKSAVFAIPLVVLLELQRKPLYYPDLPCRSLPMGMVITPTKGLAANIVFEMEKLGVRALAYCSAMFHGSGITSTWRIMEEDVIGLVPFCPLLSTEARL